MKFSTVLVTVFAGVALAAPSDYHPEYKDNVAPAPVYDPKYPEDIVPDYKDEHDEEDAADYTHPIHEVVHYRRGGDYPKGYPKGYPKPGYGNGGNGGDGDGNGDGDNGNGDGDNGNGDGDNGNGGGDGDNGNGDGDNGNGGGDGDNGNGDGDNGNGDGDNGNGDGDNGNGGGQTPPYNPCPDRGLLAATGPRCCSSDLLNIAFVNCVLAAPTSPENFKATCGTKKPVCCPINVGEVASLLCQTPIGI